MACASAEEDVNDLFDDILLAEDRFQQEGFQKGVKHGEQVGYQEGYGMGVEKGSQIGTEIGFYHGFINTMSILSEKDGTQTERKRKVLQTLLEMVENFPLSDPTDPSLQEKLDRIRAKFKQVCSLLNIKPEYSGQGNTGISF